MRPSMAERTTVPIDFSAQTYKEIHEDLRNLSDDELIEHYICHGIAEGRWYRSPRENELPAGFDVRQYIYFNPDLSHLSDIQAKIHYVMHGQQEGRRYRDELFDSSRQAYESFLKDVRQWKSDEASRLLREARLELACRVVGSESKRRLVFVDHYDEARTGACVYLVRLARLLGPGDHLVVLAPGNVQEKRRVYARDCVVDYHGDSHILYWLLRDARGDAVLVNSSALAYVDLLPFRGELGKRVVFHSHEFPEHYIPWVVSRHVPDYVVGDVIADAYEAATGRRPCVQPPIFAPSPRAWRQRVCPRRGLAAPLAHLRRDYRLVALMVGELGPRKNPGLFDDLARLLPDVAFLWVGGRSDQAARVFSKQKNLHHLPHCDDWLRMAKVAVDVLLLTSSRDPCPYVVIEALSAMIPVVAFEGALGYRHPSLSGMYTAIPGEPSAAKAAEQLRSMRRRSTRSTRGSCAAVQEHISTFSRLTASYARDLGVA